MTDLFKITAECRLLALTIEDLGNGWGVRLHTEPRVGRGNRRALLQLNDRWYLPQQPYPIANRRQVDEMLAEAVLQQRLPGID